MDAADLTDLTTLIVRGLPKIAMYEGQCLVCINGISDLFGYNSDRWKQTSGLKAQMLRCDIPYFEIKGRISDYIDNQHGVEVDGLTYQVIMPLIQPPPVGKTRVQKLFLLSPVNMQRLGLKCCDMCLVDSILSHININHNGLSDSLYAMKPTPQEDILKAALNECNIEP